jgi:hypothetical protein
MNTSTQDMVRPGECVDLYYYDAETNVKQCFPTTQNTKFVQAFQNPTGGSSVFTIPPNQGIQDIVLSFQFANPGAGAIAIPRGWGYALIKQVSFRYGGSSQYFLTGDQILQNALRAQPNLAEATFTSETRDASTRLSKYLRLRSKLATCLSRETAWKQ